MRLKDLIVVTPQEADALDVECFYCPHLLGKAHQRFKSSAEITVYCVLCASVCVKVARG